jgi:hypothetical protein
MDSRLYFAAQDPLIVLPSIQKARPRDQIALVIATHRMDKKVLGHQSEAVTHLIAQRFGTEEQVPLYVHSEPVCRLDGTWV